MPAKGTTCLYRPVPPGFDELFIQVGWGSIEAETNAHAKTIVKWIALRNNERIRMRLPTLQEARRAVVLMQGRTLHPKLAVEMRPKSAAARYVLGRTRRPIRWPNPQPRFWDFGLLPGVASMADRKPRAVLMSVDRAARIIERGARGIEASAEFLAGMAKAAELLRQQGVDG
jgi:hypothetical protein